MQAVFLAGVMSLEAAIAQKTEGKPVTEVTELVLDQCKTSKVTGLSKFNNLKVLQLNDCGLTSLEDFPTLPSLQRLELADNNLSEGLDALQDAGLIQLRVLVLAGNKFAQVETLESLVCRSTAHCLRVALRTCAPAALSPTALPHVQGGCPNLRELDMYGCPMTNKEDYRDAVFEMLPNLKYLDGLDPDGNEKPEDDEDEDDYGEDGEEDEDGDSLLEDSEQEGLGEDRRGPPTRARTACLRQPAGPPSELRGFVRLSRAQSDCFHQARTTTTTSASTSAPAPASAAISAVASWARRMAVRKSMISARTTARRESPNLARTMARRASQTWVRMGPRSREMLLWRTPQSGSVGNQGRTRAAAWVADQLPFRSAPSSAHCLSHRCAVPTRWDSDARCCHDLCPSCVGA